VVILLWPHEDHILADGPFHYGFKKKKKKPEEEEKGLLLM